MKSGNEWQTAPGGHLLRQQGGNRMRNRVMDVQQIKPVSLSQFRHARRKGQRVRRILEERISGYFYLVVEDAGRIGIETDGIGIADEMHLVPPQRELQTQLRSDDPAAPIGGIAGNADPHGSSIIR